MWRASTPALEHRRIRRTAPSSIDHRRVRPCGNRGKWRWLQDVGGGGVKALTLTQPWATLMAIGAKRMETRSWRTAYRGPLAIHAAKGMPDWAMDLCMEEPFRSVLFAAGFAGVCDLPRGGVIATCRLVGCVPTKIVSASEREREFGDFGPGRFAWVLDEVVALGIPLPAKGTLGLWEWTT